MTAAALGSTSYNYREPTEEIKKKSSFSSRFFDNTDIIQSVAILALNITLLAAKIFKEIPTQVPNSAKILLNYPSIITLNRQVENIIKCGKDFLLAIRNRDGYGVLITAAKIVCTVIDTLLVVTNIVAATIGLTGNAALSLSIYLGARTVSIPSLILSIGINSDDVHQNTSIKNKLTDINKEEMIDDQIPKITAEFIRCMRNKNFAEPKSDEAKLALKIHSKMDLNPNKDFQKKITNILCDTPIENMTSEQADEIFELLKETYETEKNEQIQKISGEFIRCMRGENLAEPKSDEGKLALKMHRKIDLIPNKDFNDNINVILGETPIEEMTLDQSAKIFKDLKDSYPIMKKEQIKKISSEFIRCMNDQKLNEIKSDDGKLALKMHRYIELDAYKEFKKSMDKILKGKPVEQMSDEEAEQFFRILHKTFEAKNDITNARLLRTVINYAAMFLTKMYPETILQSAVFTATSLLYVVELLFTKKRNTDCHAKQV